MSFKVLCASAATSNLRHKIEYLYEKFKKKGVSGSIIFQKFNHLKQAFDIILSRDQKMFE